MFPHSTALQGRRDGLFQDLLIAGTSLVLRLAVVCERWAVPFFDWRAMCRSMQAWLRFWLHDLFNEHDTLRVRTVCSTDAMLRILSAFQEVPRFAKRLHDATLRNYVAATSE